MWLSADAYMKGSLQFEGPNTAGSEGYSAGFGLIALPTCAEVELKGTAFISLKQSLKTVPYLLRVMHICPKLKL